MCFKAIGLFSGMWMDHGLALKPSDLLGFVAVAGTSLGVVGLWWTAIMG
jgi:hypothetical protein